MENKRKNLVVLLKNISFKNMRKDQILIMFLIGILLLVISWPTGNRRKEAGNETAVFQSEEGEAESGESYVRYLEARLAKALSQMDGVGETSVMITLKSSAEKVVEKDLDAADEDVTESDSQGGARSTKNTSRNETTVYNDGGSSGEPYVSKELSPQVEGVVVIAEGGDNPVVKQNITEAVQALFGIDTHKIRIMKKSSK